MMPHYLQDTWWQPIATLPLQSWEYHDCSFVECYEAEFINRKGTNQNRMGQKSILYIDRFYEMTWRYGPENRKETKNERP